MTKIGHAMSLAAEIHEDQIDKSGEPYIDHIIEVRRRSRKSFDRKHQGIISNEYIASERELVQVVAILHDVLEDFQGTKAEKDYLRVAIEQAFGERALRSIECLTKEKGEPYDDYIERVAGDWIARLVKLCDLSHNLEAWRIPSGSITEKEFNRWDKYHRAFVRLMKED